MISNKYVIRGNRDFIACAAVSTTEYVEEMKGSMIKSDFAQFKSQRKDMIEEWDTMSLSLRYERKIFSFRRSWFKMSKG